MWNKGLAADGTAAGTTRSGRCQCAVYIILGLGVLLGGCSASRVGTESDFSKPSPNRLSAVNAQSVEPNSDDLTDRPATSSQEPQPTHIVDEADAPTPADPGAALLVRRLSDVIDTDRADRQARCVISTCAIRNQSRAQPDEFDAMTQHLAELLDRAGHSNGLAFTADRAQPADYRLGGSAYLINADGFDQWELYLSLRPADRAWTLWQSDAPVRLLRIVRRRGQQLFILDESRRR